MLLTSLVVYSPGAVVFLGNTMWANSVNTWKIYAFSLPVELDVPVTRIPTNGW